VALLIVVALASVAVRFAFIEGSLPYARHGDEAIWGTRALKILQSGDLNPHRFTKPGAHIYFMTAGLALGFVRAAAHGEVQELGTMGSKLCFEYAVPRAAGVAKGMYAVVSVLAMVLAGVLAGRLSGVPATLWLAPLFVAVSRSYLYFSWWYMNTNVLGAFGILATVAYPFCARAGVATQRKALLLGVLCGLTIATKYNLFLILVPACLYFVLYHRDRWLSHGLLVVAVAMLTFFVVTPYALLDVDTFVRHVGQEAYHYASGHFDGSTATFEPGWPMFLEYFAVLYGSFGGLVLALALAGVVRLLVRDWRSAAVVFLFPVLFVAYMSQQRTFFERNLLSVHLFVGIAAAVGLCALVDAVTARLAGKTWFAGRPRAARLAVAGLVGLVVVAFLPWRSIRAAYSPDPEPRHLAVQWVLDHAAPPTLILVERRLALSTRRLEEQGFDVVPLALSPVRDTLAGLRARYGDALLLYPRFRSKEHEAIVAGLTPLATFGRRPVDATPVPLCGRFPPRVRIGRL